MRSWAGAGLVFWLGLSIGCDDGKSACEETFAEYKRALEADPINRGSHEYDKFLAAADAQAAFSAARCRQNTALAAELRALHPPEDGGAYIEKGIGSHNPRPATHSSATLLTPDGSEQRICRDSCRVETEKCMKGAADTSRCDLIRESCMARCDH